MSLVKFEAVPITYPSTALLHPIICAINKTKPIVFTNIAPYELVLFPRSLLTFSFLEIVNLADPVKNIHECIP